MTRKIGLILLGLGVVFFSGCTGADTSDDSSSSTSSSTSSSSSSAGNIGSCYDSGGGICGYYSNMTSSEYSDVSSRCDGGYAGTTTVTWYDSQNVCDGNTQFNHHSPDKYSYTQICYMDTSGSDSHLDVYNYGLTYDEALWSQDQCYSNGGTSSILEY